MTKFTPGPWFAIEAESMKYCSVVEFEYGSGARGTVCLVGTDGATVGAAHLDEQNANARLMASAPDLYAALNDLATHGILGAAESNASGNPEWSMVGPLIAAARAALSKASDL